MIIIIAITGIFGGIVNYFRLPQTEDSFSNYIFIKSIVIGIAASSLVPLFLEMISSDLLQTSKESTIDYFIIGGFCLVSGIFSNSFIDSIGKKVLNQLDNMKHEMNSVKKEVDEVTTEAENESSSTDMSSIDLGL
ncbi:MAG: hypothetical protein MI922_22725 [Bacteroidales bacterium]|nr:hypothetical protein [Bacteroidales bacterium]